MSTKPRYWLILFNQRSWETFLRIGAGTAGFRARRWRTVQRFKTGDYLLCYLTGVSRWIGALTVTGAPYQDDTRLWPDAVLPVRVAVKPVVLLTPETAVPITELRDQLSIFSPDTLHWTARLRQSPALWPDDDGEAVMETLLEAQVSPVVRELDMRKLRYQPRAFRSLQPATAASAAEPVNISSFREPSTHTEIQWLLLHLGSAMGLDVWVARNDRGRSYAGQRFADLPGMLTELPRQFDPASMTIVELIDVLWLQEQSIVAAFEIESTSTIYSGLLRMADLVALQPNLHIPLYLVAPDSRRQKVLSEVNRPTFRRLRPALASICRYIPFTGLRSRYQEVLPLLPHVNPSMLDTIAEPCDNV
ncbi:MAG: hypothetical protein R3F53_06590 [Gammaproteobacteria bacterium]